MRHDALARRYDQLNPRERLGLWLEAKARDDTAEQERLMESCPRATYRQLHDEFDRPYGAINKIVMALSLDLARGLGRLRMLQGCLSLMPLYLLCAAEEASERAWAENAAQGPEGVSSIGPAQVQPASECRESLSESGEPPVPPAGPPTVADTTDENEEAHPWDPTEAVDQIDRTCAEHLPHTNSSVERVYEGLARRCREKLSGKVQGLDRFSRRALGISARTLLAAYVPPVLQELDEFKVVEAKPDEELAKGIETLAWQTWKRLAFDA